MSNKITIYSQDGCVQCRFAKQFLDREGAEYTEINIDHVDGVREQLREEGYRQMPVIKAGDKTITGFRPVELKGLL